MPNLNEGRRDALRTVEATPGTHPGLWIDRYLTEQRVQHEIVGLTFDKERAVAARTALIKSVVSKKAPEGYADALSRWKLELESQGVRVVWAVVPAVGRVLVGAGQKGPAEFGITLHHTWGVPVLPGSSLKGIAASAADRFLRADKPGMWERRPNAAEVRPGAAPNAYDALFGDVEEVGAVVFHDAWYIPTAGDNGLHRDVLTVHHPEYYQQGKEYSETEGPNPVPFVSAAGTFLVTLELHPSLDPTTHGAWLQHAWESLRLGLEHLGVGAKTNAGYGRVLLPEYAQTKHASIAESALVAALPSAEERVRYLGNKHGPDALRNWLAGGAVLDAMGDDAEHVLAAYALTNIPKAKLKPEFAHMVTARETEALSLRRGRLLDPAARVADVLRHEGQDVWWLRRWLKREQPLHIPGLPRDEVHVRAALAAIADKQYHPKPADVPDEVRAWIQPAPSGTGHIHKRIGKDLLDEKVLTRDDRAKAKRREELIGKLQPGDIDPTQAVQAIRLLERLGVSADELSALRVSYPD